MRAQQAARTAYQTRPSCRVFAFLGDVMTDGQQTLNELPLWLLITLALAGGVTGELWRADKDGLCGSKIVRRLVLRSGSSVMCGVSTMMLLYAAEVPMMAAAAVGSLTAMAGADLAISFYERWAARRLGLTRRDADG
ncbi:pyocin holin [Pseudomonas sp. StFLB209]|nr:pyocin holin [Pseudomonas sp. StFLB209]